MSNNIHSLRVGRGWSMRELAERMGTHFTTIAKIERSQRKLTWEWAERFAEAFGVGVGEIDPGFALAQDNREVKVPLIGLVAAGNWREAISIATEFLTVPADMADPNVFALEVHGDSMDRFALPGDYVIVDPDERDLSDGQFYIVMNEDHETTFKQFRADPARLEPSSHNEEHRPIMLGQEPVTVVAKVVGLLRRYK